MNALASPEPDEGWRIFRSDRRGKCAYRNAGDSSVAVVDFTQNSQPLPPGFGRLDDLLDEFEADPELEQGLTETRRRLAAERMSQGELSLALLRMAQGLTQTGLAGAIKTKQPHISRLEAGLQEPGLTTLRQLCAVLDVDMNTLDAALSR
jgi:DNA-binding XRE family transcriptional regulator